MELVYQGEPIRRRDEKLNLTDMWRAAGADPNKRPYEWARYEGAQFIEFIADSLNTGTARIIEAERGRDGGTLAHWQVGLAYAKYLSPAFHAWCNEAVRDVMEGAVSTTPAQPLTGADLISAFDAFGRGFRGDVSTAISAAVEPIHGRLATVESDVAELRIDVATGLALLRAHAANKRSVFREETKRDLLRAAHEAGGNCPCCKRNRVTNPDGSRALHVEFHHIVGRHDNSPRNGVPLCRTCHGEFTAEPAKMRAEYAPELEAFHRFRERLPGAQMRLLA